MAVGSTAARWSRAVALAAVPPPAPAIPGALLVGRFAVGESPRSRM